jgi:hypothetical protein
MERLEELLDSMLQGCKACCVRKPGIYVTKPTKRGEPKECPDCPAEGPVFAVYKAHSHERSRW